MMRTKNKKGVTIPSQIRYIHYFERALELSVIPSEIPVPRISIHKVRLYSIPKFSMLGGCTPFFRASSNQIEYLSKKKFPLKFYKNEPVIDFSDIKGLDVMGDVLLEFYNKPLMSSKVYLTLIDFT